MRRALVLPLLVSLAFTACSKHPHPGKVADVPGGLFYTTDEIRGLSGSERDAYCDALDSQIRLYRTEGDRLLATADSLSKSTDSLKTINTGLVSQIRDLDNEVRQLRLARRSSTTYLVKAGDTLLTISTEVYGKPDRWRDIFEANKDLLKDSNQRPKPGLRLTIPAM